MLSEMSLEELWKLFPIFLTEHKDCWKKWFDEESERLESLLLQKEIIRISHIGSTAVDTIWAKPIIDILVEISRECNMEEIKEILTCNGYICMNQNQDRMSFNRGYTEKGFAEKVYHLHLRYEGDNDELYFRDYLIEYPDMAKEYEKMKLDLWNKYEYNRDGYTNAKAELVIRYTEAAKQIFINKY